MSGLTVVSVVSAAATRWPASPIACSRL